MPLLPVLNQLNPEKLQEKTYPEKTCTVGLLQEVEPFILEPTIRAFKRDATDADVPEKNPEKLQEKTYPEKTCPVGLLQQVEPFILETTIRTFKRDATDDDVKNFIENNQEHLKVQVTTDEVSINQSGKVSPCSTGPCKNALTTMIYIGQDLIYDVLGFIAERTTGGEKSRLASIKLWAATKLASAASGVIDFASNEIFKDGQIKIALRVTDIGNPEQIRVEIIADGSEHMNGRYYKFLNFVWRQYNKYYLKNEAPAPLNRNKINDILTSRVRDKIAGKAN